MSRPVIIAFILTLLFISVRCESESGPAAARRKRLQEACNRPVDMSKYSDSLEAALNQYFGAMSDPEGDVELNLPTEQEYLAEYWCHLEDKWTMNMNNDMDSMLGVDRQLRDIVLEGHRGRFRGKRIEVTEIREKRRDEYKEIVAIYPAEVVITENGRRDAIEEIKIVVKRDGKFRLMKVAP